MKRCLLFIFSLLILLAPALLLAHGDATHVMGTVTETGQNHIVVKTTKGKRVTVTINSETIFVHNGIVTKDVRPAVGNRMIAETVKDGDNLVARELRFSSPKSK